MRYNVIRWNERKRGKVTVGDEIEITIQLDCEKKDEQEFSVGLLKYLDKFVKSQEYYLNTVRLNKAFQKKLKRRKYRK